MAEGKEWECHAENLKEEGRAERKREKSEGKRRAGGKEKRGDGRRGRKLYSSMRLLCCGWNRHRSSHLLLGVHLPPS